MLTPWTFSRKEVAEYFNVHERTVERWLRKGALKGYKLGDGNTALWRIPKSEVKKFMDRHVNTKKK